MKETRPDLQVHPRVARNIQAGERARQSAHHVHYDAPGENAKNNVTNTSIEQQYLPITVF
jgi:hypothetical protein